MHAGWPKPYSTLPVGFAARKQIVVVAVADGERDNRTARLSRGRQAVTGR